MKMLLVFQLNQISRHTSALLQFFDLYACFGTCTLMVKSIKTKVQVARCDYLSYLDSIRGYSNTQNGYNNLYLFSAIWKIFMTSLETCNNPPRFFYT